MNLLTNILAYFKFDSGGLTTDSVDGTYTLTNTNTVAETASGKIGYGADFGANNANKNLSVSSSFGLTKTSDWTVCWWWKGKTDANSGVSNNIVMTVEMCWGTAGSGNNNRVNIVRDMGGNDATSGRWSMYNSGFSLNATTEPITSDVLYFCVLKKVGTHLYFYVNDVQKATIAVGADTNLTPKFGFKRQDADWLTCKVVDEAVLYSYSLPSAEMTALYNSGNGLQYPFSSAPTVTTQSVSAITNTTATGNGNVTANGAATITERGVCIGASANPTTAGTKFTSAGTTGAFTASMTSLTKNTHYHARAYAINSVGTSYGADVEFDTTNVPNELRDFTNKPGAVYDAYKTTVIYAEDLALIKEWVEYLASKI